MICLCMNTFFQFPTIHLPYTHYINYIKEIHLSPSVWVRLVQMPVETCMLSTPAMSLTLTRSLYSAQQPNMVFLITKPIKLSPMFTIDYPSASSPSVPATHVQTNSLRGALYSVDSGTCSVCRNFGLPQPHVTKSLRCYRMDMLLL